MARNNAPTMKDVAAEAGVALGTVSKVFNDLPVGESYRKRVLAAAEKLGYRVNSYARGMKSNKTNTVALILPDLHNQFFSVLAEYLGKALKNKGYRMLLYLTHSKAEEEEECFRLAEQYKVDGIIALTYSSSLKLTEHVRFVSIDRHVAPDVPCISSDNYGGGQMAARKLIELGCKRLLGVQISSSVPSEADKRIDGFRSACQSAGIPYDVCWNAEDDDSIVWEFFRSHIHDGEFDFDGVFCNTDELAYRFQDALQQAGVRVPEQVQLIGFDGIQKFGYLDHFCSTIVQPVKNIAEMTVELLLREDDSALPMLACLPVKYAPGRTTKECTEWEA